MIDQEQIKEWLTREALPVSVVSGDERATWHLETHFPGPGGPRTHLVCPRDNDRLLGVLRKTDVAGNHREAMRQLTPAQFNEFKFQLLRDFLRSGVQYRLDVSPADHDLRSFLVIAEVREEGLDPQALFAALRAVHDRSLLAVMHVRHAVGDTI